MKSAFIIRRATTADLPTVQKLYQALNQHIIRTYDPTLNTSAAARRRSVKILRRAVKGKKSQLLVAVVGSRIVGFGWNEIYQSVWFRRPMRIAEGYAIYVLRKYRSIGVGRSLIQEFFRWARKNKADRIRGVTDVTNKRALKLYARLGWKPYMVILESEPRQLRIS